MAKRLSLMIRKRRRDLEGAYKRGTKDPKPKHTLKLKKATRKRRAYKPI